MKVEKTLNCLKIVIVIFFIIMFLNYFGAPQLKKFLARESMFVESFREVEASDFPVVSVARDYENLEEECYNDHRVPDNITKCLIENSDDFNNTIIDILDYKTKKSLLKSWEETFTIPYWGRIYITREPFIYPNDHYLLFKFKDDCERGYMLDFHDKNFYVESNEQLMDFQRMNLFLDKREKMVVTMSMEKIILIPEVSKCIESKDYSFMTCCKVKNIANIAVKENNNIFNYLELDKRPGWMQAPFGSIFKERFSCL